MYITIVLMDMNEVGVFVQTQTRIYNLILISASYYYAPCMALALVLYCV